jgi:hypothetical protein
MASEFIDFTYTIDGNTLTIIPTNPIVNNSQYIIKIKSLQSKTNSYKKTKNLSYTITTELSPMYCTLNDVMYLVDTFDIPEEQVLYFIRESSKYADYVMDATSVTANAEATFAMKQFVRTKTTIDCLLKAFIKKAAGFGVRGQIGVIQFQDEENYGTSIGTLLDDLKKALKGWEDALRGFEHEGRVKPRSAKRSYKQTEQTLFSSISNDLTRDMPGNV